MNLNLMKVIESSGIVESLLFQEILNNTLGTHSRSHERKC